MTDVGRIEQLTHTPGPWEIRRARVTVSIRDVHGNYITENVRPLPNQDANTHLIAAAPELLAALKAIVAVLQKEAPGTPLNHHQYDAVGIQAHAAIAKTEGR